MAKQIKGSISAKGLKVAVIAGRFNEVVTDKLVKGAVDCLEQHECKTNDIDIIWVPGSFEIPIMAKKAVESGKYDGVICAGAIIRGATPHFDYIAAETTKGIGQVSLQAEIPVVYGVLTTDTVEQAMDRAGAKTGNKGWDSSMTLMEMSDLFRKTKK
ncbi:MAG: 6,7-dimethyl-8-ribityllumazine synthase [bacterium]|nr:6,7-dimethyl-8-ribityllumazine synthase [bacterium]